MKTVNIIYDDSACTVFGAFSALEAMLTYEHRSIDQDAAGRPLKVETLSLFNALGKAADGRACIQTHQGLLDDVIACCQAHGYQVLLNDQRQRMPPAQLHFMGGFRFSQRQLLTDALKQDRSGLIGAPTRFGKTTLIVNTLRAYPGCKTVVTAPGVDLLRQTEEDIRKQCPGRKVVGIYTGSKTRNQGEDITVCSMDSLEKCDFLGTRLVLVDEPHSAVTSSRGPYLTRFANARKIGYGATLKGRFDRADILIRACIGPVLANRTYVEARNEGAVAPIEVALLKMKLRRFSCGHRDLAYRILIHNNPDFHQLVARVAREAIPEAWQTLIFIKNEDQAKGIYSCIPDGTIAMAKLLTTKERREVTERVKADEIKRCIASDIYSTGVTFHEVRALINAGGGGGSISCVQKPGRLAEIRPGKKCGVVIDFLWEVDFGDLPLGNLPVPQALELMPDKDNNAWSAVVRDSYARLSVYQEKGYHVTTHDSVESLANFVRGCV